MKITQQQSIAEGWDETKSWNLPNTQSTINYGTLG